VNKRRHRWWWVSRQWSRTCSVSLGTAPHAHATSSSIAGGRFGRLNLRRYAPVKACPVIKRKRVDCTSRGMWCTYFFPLIRMPVEAITRSIVEGSSEQLSLIEICIVVAKHMPYLGLMCIHYPDPVAYSHEVASEVFPTMVT
jgi:hypothetical protein